VTASRSRPARARPAQRPSPKSREAPAAPRSEAHGRFLALDSDRALREWRRYEGTPQRDLFRVLRERFLARHAVREGWALDVGSGPGRFTAWLGSGSTRRVALDLSLAMLHVGRDLVASLPGSPSPSVERVRADAVRPPFLRGTFREVALVGNALGFEAAAGERMLSAVEELVAPDGVLLLEIAPGSGERSNYLARLPLGAVRRLVVAPARAVLPRIEREGFRAEPVRHRPTSFHRWTVDDLERRWAGRGWKPREVMAVAPALGVDAARLAEVVRDPRAWGRLLELEEELGRRRERWHDAAAVLVAVARRP